MGAAPWVFFLFLPRGRALTDRKGSDPMTDFEDEQLSALATLTLIYPAGITLTEDRVDDIAVCESLIDSGHAVRVESDEIEGKAFQLSPVMVEAYRRNIAAAEGQAGRN
jgi:hypothetical protein